MSTLELIQAGAALNLSDDVNYTWLEEDGFGHPPLRRLTEAGPLQHGETDFGFRLLPRRIQLLILAHGASLTDLYTRRQALAAVLVPSDTPLQLRLTLADGTRRQIDCHCDAGARFGSRDRLVFAQRVALELRCPDPAWYDPTAITATYALGGGGTGFAVPTAVPTSIGASAADVLAAITYVGTWLSYPTLRIVGPITDPIITNQSTGEKLDFTGAAIAGGDWYEIDTRYGYKTVRDAAGVNRIGNLTSDSNLATFHLAAHPDVAGGANSIRIQGSGITSASQVVLTYYTRYTGI